MTKSARVTMDDADAQAAGWLLGRHPLWSDLRIERLIMRTHVIEDHPVWPNWRLNREVTRRMNGGLPGEELQDSRRGRPPQGGRITEDAAGELPELLEDEDD